MSVDDCWYGSDMVFRYGSRGMFRVDWYCMLVFFFKQKTAYESRLSLVGSEMCIKDKYNNISYFYISM